MNVAGGSTYIHFVVSGIDKMDKAIDQHWMMVQLYLVRR